MLNVILLLVIMPIVFQLRDILLSGILPVL